MSRQRSLCARRSLFALQAKRLVGAVDHVLQRVGLRLARYEVSILAEALPGSVVESSAIDPSALAALVAELENLATTTVESGILSSLDAREREQLLRLLRQLSV